jgi:hypothetical protein
LISADAAGELVSPSAPTNSQPPQKWFNPSVWKQPSVSTSARDGVDDIFILGEFEMRIVFMMAAILGLAASAHADPLDTLLKAETKAYEAWGKLPLTERKVIFVTAPAAGYGMYEERTSTVFKQDEKIVTYVEPIGYGWKTLPNGMFEMNFTVDILIKDSEGTPVVEKKDFLKNVLQSHNAAMEMQLSFTLSLSGAPAGDYTLTYTIHDHSADQESSFDQTLTLAGS